VEKFFKNSVLTLGFVFFKKRHLRKGGRFRFCLKMDEKRKTQQDFPQNVQIFVTEIFFISCHGLLIIIRKFPELDNVLKISMQCIKQFNFVKMRQLTDFFTFVASKCF